MGLFWTFYPWLNINMHKAYCYRHKQEKKVKLRADTWTYKTTLFKHLNSHRSNPLWSPNLSPITDRDARCFNRSSRNSAAGRQDKLLSWEVPSEPHIPGTGLSYKAQTFTSFLKPHICLFSICKVSYTSGHSCHWQKLFWMQSAPCFQNALANSPSI